jgi:ATP-dependent 26S proteasome regulatory subunit
VQRGTQQVTHHAPLLLLQVMGKSKVLVKVHPEGKYVVDIDKDIDIAKLTPGARVALRNDSYTLHFCLPTKVDPLVSLMKVEKVPDSTYDMIGGLDQQIKEIKEVSSASPAQEVDGGSSRCRSSSPVHGQLANAAHTPKVARVAP